QAASDVRGAALDHAIVGAGEAVLGKRADGFEQRAAESVIEIPARQRLLPAAHQAGMDLAREFGRERRRAHSALRQAESGIDVWIRRAEPVAECGPREARSGTRGSALQHVVFSIEEIGRVAGIKRERLESRERSERRGGPLPSVAGHLRKTAFVLAGGV